MKKTLLLIILLKTIITPACVKAQTYALSINSSTLGINLEGIRSFGPRYNARVGFTCFSYKYSDGDNKDYYLGSDIKMSSVSAIFDWFPYEGIFHLSGGLFINFNEVNALLTPKESHDVGGRIYSPEMLGNLSADLRFNKITPYIGIGFGNANGPDSGFSFNAGAVYHGPPGVKLSADGLLEPSTEQAPIIEDNISWFKFYPVISLGYIFKF